MLRSSNNLSLYLDCTFVERTNKLFTWYQSTFRRYQLQSEKLNPANRWISRSFLDYFLYRTKNSQNVIEGRL